MENKTKQMKKSGRRKFFPELLATRQGSAVVGTSQSPAGVIKW
jgi:hypothetical protein